MSGSFPLVLKLVRLCYSASLASRVSVVGMVRLLEQCDSQIFTGWDTYDVSTGPPLVAMPTNSHMKTSIQSSLKMFACVGQIELGVV